MKLIRTWAPRILTIIAVLALVFMLGRALILFLDYNRILIGFPYNVDYGEGPILDQVMRLSRFENIYPNDISEPPYIIGNYPPMYQLVQVPFAWLFGPAFWYGRVINLVSILAAAFFIGSSLYTITKDTVAAVAGGLMLMVIPYILHWSGFVRVDSFALGLSWAALYFIIRHPDKKKYIILTAVFLTLAIYTRQSYGLAAPFAAFVWLLSHKPWKRAFELALWTAGFSIVFFGVLYLVSGGGVFFNIITANVNPFFWGTVETAWRVIREQMGYLVVTSVLYILGGLWFKQKAWWVATPYLVGGTLSGITIGKDGSNVNYLLEFSAALAFMSGAVLAWAGTSWKGTKWEGQRWFLKVAAMVLLVVQIASLFPWTKNEYYRWVTDRAKYERDEIAQMVALVEQAETPVLADEFMGLVVLGGQNLAFQPFEYKQLVTGGIWDESPFIKSLANQEFDYVLLYDPPGWDSAGARWTTGQLFALRANYREIDRLANTRILVPIDSLRKSLSD
jgi:hypothetical protein